MKKEKTKRFVGKDGSFKPSNPPPEGHMSIQYLEELCEWVYYHDYLNDDEKLEHILSLERYIQKLLNGGDNDRPPVRGGINYIPTWSKKLQNKSK